ncbi:MAG TPA: dihydrolipoamide acetyltransferase family protein [Candidatus Angelobacter sp.]|nr:dihydrolipoamide acetyltransferase family protein [Candidatus Angelobacter sp.]
MASLLTMPGVAANATEAVLSAWVVPVGAAFAAGDPIVTIETDKAVVDVEAEADGVVLHAIAEPGASVEVGQPIAVLGAPGEVVADLTALLAELGVVAPRTPATSGAGAAGSTPPGPGAATHAAAGAAVSTPAPAASAGSEAHGVRLFASPIARRLAREAGLPLDSLRGTGPNGRVVRRDVEQALAERLAVPSTAAASAAAVAPTPVPGAVTEVPHSRMRRAIAARLTESKQTIPHFYVRGTADVGRLVRARERINARGDVKVSINDMVLKAVAAAHVAEPDMNVVWTSDAVLRYSSVDVAVAIATDRGLVTPVLRSVESLSLTQIAVSVRDFAQRAVDGRLRQDELEGGTVSVSNLGMYGTEEFSAIINPPQSAILAVGAVRSEPVVRGDALEIGSVLRVTLSVDHRSVDGVAAARWMRTFLTLLDDPVQMLV